MNCPGCKQDSLEVLHVLQGGGRSEARDLRCTKCGYICNTVTFLVERPQHTKHGKGVRALASKLRDGKLDQIELKP